MNMEEFRNALASDARDENEKLKMELEELKKNSSKEIKELKEELDQYKRWTKSLANRCKIFTEGTLCLFCTVESCEHYAETQKELNEMAEYMTKHKIPRTEEGYNKAAKHMKNKRDKRKKGNNNEKI